ncbi:MAG: carboxypeptidase M32 [Alphaproteobacteria bacterium]|nr:carboxypeptidase M32 [Alphaproteobacteria bacterium]
MKAYHELEAIFRRRGVLGGVQSLLHWDTAVNMPDGAATVRGEQLAALKVLQHELITDPRVGALIEAAAGVDGLDPWQRANLRKMRRRWLHATAVDPTLIEAETRAATECEMIWRGARKDADFARVAPALTILVERVRETAARKADALGVSPYEALLDQYEPGLATARIDTLFADLEAFLPDFLERALAHQNRRPPAVAPTGHFPVEKQRALGVRFMQALGFDFEGGRLDISHHPFCSGVPEDIRITTRYDEADFTSALMGVLHETGHALYEKGLPEVWRNQPVGGAVGMAVHESQSLLIEMQACRSRPFLDYAAPLMREAFGGHGPDWEPENLFRLYTHVARSFIRVDADEVTYPAHVILRDRLERDLIAGRLAVADIPAAWNDGMGAILGIVPANDAEGCLQDIHWYSGGFGYFPTYTLGALAAAQLFQAACRTVPAIPAAIGRGDFGPLIAWLRHHVHAKGSLHDTDGLLREATGEPLGASAFKAHLASRYLA